MTTEHRFTPAPTSYGVHDPMCPKDPTSDYWDDPKPSVIADLIYQAAAVADGLMTPIIGGTSGWVGVKRGPFDGLASIFACRCADIATERRTDRGAWV